MRKRDKNQCIELLNTLLEAHDAIEKEIEKKNIAGAAALLGQCQQGAISAGTMIEDSEGEGTEPVGILEAYCEQAYQFHEQLAHGAPVNARQMRKRLGQTLLRARSSIKSGIDTRVEAVFLPYKASMWDSLESVWRAADEDPGCDAYVVSVPYYDRKPGGSFGQMHDEAELYPEYVPVMKFGEYDFENRKPDMIFFHNPYDDCNYVTSVHPFFYSKNLKQFTEQLVYIPYFVLGEVDPDDKNAIDGIKHFCLLPGVWNADKVIVQSEAMREAYIRVLVEHAPKGDRAKARKTWEDKICGLGSPKIDKVLDTRREDVDIPKEWQEIILKPSGEWKKVILYNTSVSALLAYDKKMLNKMEQVFEVFQGHLEDVALLWRPHPLIQATIESMRPKLWQDYRDIVKRYKAEGWGIYDDSADVNRALAISDAYYGDPSSLVELCKSIGMPVMIQNPEILS